MTMDYAEKFWKSFERVTDPIKLNDSDRFDLCATIIRSKRNGGLLFDLRVWVNGEPTRGGVYLTAPTAENVKKLMEEFLEMVAQPSIEDELGYNPFEG